MKNYCAAALAAGLLLLGGSASAQEKKIKRSKLCPLSKQRVAAQSAGATIRGFSTEKENGQTLYEAELTVNGHSKDISMTADGSIVEIEEQVSMDSASSRSEGRTAGKSRQWQDSGKWSPLYEERQARRLRSKG